MSVGRLLLGVRAVRLQKGDDLLRRWAQAIFQPSSSSYSGSGNCICWLSIWMRSVMWYNWISATTLLSSNVALGCSRIRGQYSRYFCCRLKGRAFPIAELDHLSKGRWRRK